MEDIDVILSTREGSLNQKIMDRQYINELFPRYDEAGKDLILRAYNIAAEALKEQKRSNGNPFIEHPVAVAKIACDEIGLSAECIAAVFLHEATRFFPETEIPKGSFGQDVMTMVDGRVLYENGEYKTIDVEKIKHDFKEIQKHYFD